MRRSHRHKPKHDGMALLESLLALALFAAGMLAIGHLMQRGSDSALRAEIEALACVHCESAIDRVVSGSHHSGTQRRFGNLVVATTINESQWSGISVIEATASLVGTPDQKVFVLTKLARVPSWRSKQTIREGKPQ